MTTHQELTNKLLEEILKLEGNEEAKMLISRHYLDLYDFKNMTDVSIRVIPEGQLAIHDYSGGVKINATEIAIMSDVSAKIVLDSIIRYIDQLRDLGATQIVVGIRSSSITQIEFTPPSLYFNVYSFSGTNDDNTMFWCIGPSGNIENETSKKAA